MIMHQKKKKALIGKYRLRSLQIQQYYLLKDIFRYIKTILFINQSDHSFSPVATKEKQHVTARYNEQFNPGYLWNVPCKIQIPDQSAQGC